MNNTIRMYGAFMLMLMIGVYYLWRRERYGRRRYWRHPTLVWEEGEFNTLFKKYKHSSHDKFFRYTRMEVWQFEELLSLIRPKLTKKSQRLPVSAEERLAITLRFLAHGGSLVTLSEAYRRGLSTVQAIVIETCNAIWEVLSPLYVKVPDERGWLNAAQDFWGLWNFRNCVGAVDGKHVDIVCPPNAGSVYFNYHQRHSTVLMALCDARYRFTYVNIGSHGSQHDSSILTASQFGQDLLAGNLQFPEERPLPFKDRPRFPFWIVADQAFPLSEHIMRPYPGRNLTEEQRIFNYRLSRARRCIENAFGILVGRWRLLRNRLQAFPENVDSYVKACIALHNFIITTNQDGTPNYCPPHYVDREDADGNIIHGGWRVDAQPDDGQPLLLQLGRVGANNPGIPIIRMRNAVAAYLNSDEGSVDWQWRQVWAGYECECNTTPCVAHGENPFVIISHFDFNRKILR